MDLQLTKVDVERLAKEASPDRRAAVAGKVAAQFGGQRLTTAERRIAEDILRSFMKDAESRVREALSANLKSVNHLPHDMAMDLARDIDSVALPILEFCEILSDDDLIEIVQGKSALKQQAVAQRAQVSAEVADALIETGNETAVAQLVANSGADLSEPAFTRVLTRYEGSGVVSGSLVERPELPPAISEKLIDVATRKLQDYLAQRHRLPAHLVRNMVRRARERATAEMLSDTCADDAGLEDLIEQMHATGRLTPSSVVESLSSGDLRFFEMAMARLAGVPVGNARTLIYDRGNLGIQAILEAANC